MYIYIYICIHIDISFPVCGCTACFVLLSWRFAMAPQVEKKTAPSLAVPIAVEDDLDGTSKRKKGEETPGFDHGGRRKSGEKTMIGDGI